MCSNKISSGEYDGEPNQSWYSQQLCLQIFVAVATKLQIVLRVYGTTYTRQGTGKQNQKKYEEGERSKS